MESLTWSELHEAETHLHLPSLTLQPDSLVANRHWNCKESEGSKRARYVCALSANKIQTVLDLLLLSREVRPVLSAGTLSQCREVIQARCRGIQIVFKHLQALFHDRRPDWNDVASSVEGLSELSIALLESSGHAAYLMGVLQEGSSPHVPGPVDKFVRQSDPGGAPRFGSSGA
ncbi:unnamed protein product [Darwinula stevensoni]|uniref:Uncharacterized protein n=1 Tax=Darwinula stevensoni TaxID=69355 RepID=A0A7R8XA37_9CRUS|nr:unnamed protein product [Darwinula stevensoni]CAG0884954.1 unnamed protein product [Darwinula stevensoni]